MRKHIVGETVGWARDIYVLHTSGSLPDRILAWSLDSENMETAVISGWPQSAYSPRDQPLAQIKDHACDTGAVYDYCLSLNYS